MNDTKLLVGVNPQNQIDNFKCLLCLVSSGFYLAAKSSNFFNNFLAINHFE